MDTNIIRKNIKKVSLRVPIAFSVANEIHF
jgi:hypothetical protein